MDKSILQDIFIKGLQYGETGSFKNPDEQVSDKGAFFAMQVLPSTAMDAGLEGVTNLTAEETKDPVKMNDFGRRYGLALLDRYDGNYRRAAGAYVRGFGDEDKEKALGPKSANYVQKVSNYIETAMDKQQDTTSQPETQQDTTPQPEAAVPRKASLGLADYRTQTFVDAVNSFNKELTRDNVTSHAIESGFDPDSYREELGKYIETIDSGRNAIPDSTSVGRIAGKALGEAGSGIADFVSFVAGQFEGGDKAVENLSDFIYEIQDEVPDDIQRLLKSRFDPATPDDIGGDVEYVLGHVGSYLIPMTGFVKGINLATKGVQAVTKGRVLGPSIKQIDDAVAKFKPPSGVLKPDTAAKVNKARKAANIRKVVGNTAKYELGFLGAATVVESPDENFINILVNTFPQTMEFLKPLKTDPTNTEAQQRLQAFLNNALAGAITGPLLSSRSLVKAFRDSGEPTAEKLASTVNKMENSSVIEVSTPLKELGETTTGPQSGWRQRIAGRLTSRMGTNSPLVGSIVRMEQAGPAALAIAKATVRQLKQAARKDFGKKGFKNDDNITLMNSALAGSGKALQQLSQQAPNVFKTIGTMRNDIDSLSKAISDNLPSGELKVAIDSGYNSYLNRTYKAFEDVNWKGLKDPFFKTPKGEQVKDAAQHALGKDGKGFATEDIPKVMEWIALGMPRAGTKDIVALNKNNNKVIKNFIETLSDFSSLRGNSPVGKRTNIAKPFRQLMGEVKSPYENYARTFEKINILKAEQDYLREVLQNVKRYEMGQRGLGKGGLVPPEKGFVPFKADVLEARLNRLGGGSRGGTQITKDGSTTLSDNYSENFMGSVTEIAEKEFGFPLEELYINPVYAQAIKNGTEILSPTDGLIKTWIKGKALSQIMKTVASPATHARNVMGNNIIMLANGMLPFGLRGEMTTFIRRLGDMETREMAEALAEAIREGVIDSGVKAGTVRAQIKDMASDPQGFINKTMDKTLVTRQAKGTARKIFRLYQDEDNLYKFMHYNKTKNYLRKAYPNESADAIIKLAGERTRDLMPNYNLVSRQLKHMRRWPIGDFLSFPAEMVRVTKNLGKYTLRDIRSGNPTLMMEGMKKLGGMTAAGLGTDIAMQYSMDMFGINADQAEALNTVSYDYEKDVPKLFLSSIFKDANKHNVIQYVNFGPIDPFDYVKYAGRAVHNALLTNEDVDWEDFALRVLNKQFGPFVNPSMVIKGAAKVYEGVADFDNDREGDIQKVLAYALDPFTPGFMPAVERYRSYYDSLETLNKNREGEGPIGPYGQSLSENDSDLFAQLAGVRVQTLDLNNQMAQKISQGAKKVKEAKSTFTKSDAVRNQDKGDPEALVLAFVNSQELKFRDMQKLRKIILPFLKLTPDGKTMTYNQLKAILSKDKRYALKDKAIVSGAINNKFRADRLTKDNLRALLKGGKIESRNDPVLEIIYEFIADMDGTRLED